MALMAPIRNPRNGARVTREGKVVGFAPGVFDVFHMGHLNILLRAKEQCDYLIVGVVTDERVEAVKGKTPMMPIDERRELVAALDLVDEVVDDDSTDKVEMWERLHFDVIFKGDDWRGTAKGDQLEAGMASVGAKVIYFPYTQHVSSTRLRDLINEANARKPASNTNTQLSQTPTTSGATE